MPFSSPGDLPHPGIEPRPPALQADALPTELPRKLLNNKPCMFYLRHSPFKLLMLLKVLHHKFLLFLKCKALVGSLYFSEPQFNPLQRMRNVVSFLLTSLESCKGPGKDHQKDSVLYF